MENETLKVGWNEFETNMGRAFRELRDDFLDVTLGCEDVRIQAHKFILSASSTFFRNVFRNNPHSHPLLYLLGINKTSLRNVVDFMYHGEVSIPKDDLSMFLDVAQQLGVKGLSEILEKEKNSLEIQETKKIVPCAEIKTESVENETISVDDSMNVNETIVMVNPEIVPKNKLPSEKWEIKVDNVCDRDTVGTGDDMNDLGCESGSIIIKEELPDVSDIGAKPSCLVIDKCFSMNKDFITERLQRTYKSLDIQKTKEEPKSNLYEKTTKKEPNSVVERPRLRIHKTIKYESGDSSSESCSDTEIPGIGYRRLQIQNKIICRICRKRIPKASLKQHLVRMHFKEKLTEIYHNVVKERQCTFCERCFLGYGPSAIIEHIGAFHNKVFDFYKT